MPVQIVPGYDYEEDIRQLFAEYTALLTEGDAEFRRYLEIQHYDEELAHLEAKYGQPHGRLYLALLDGQTAGCIGLRRIDESNCEMKRLYVRPEFRSMGIGDLLASKVVEDARAIGYSCMLLDTFPFLQRAIGMYRKLGFYEIPKYNNSPMASTIYMKLDL